MPEIGTSSSMSGDRKRGVGHRPQATAPILDSTKPVIGQRPRMRRHYGEHALTGFQPAAPRTASIKEAASAGILSPRQATCPSGRTSTSRRS
jgi:hypothetical protein